MSTRLLLITVVLCLSARAQTCAPFPSGLIPFTAIYYTSGTSSTQLAVGAPGLGGANAFLARIPMISAPDQLFCGSRIELAPGRFFDGVYVPRSPERVGDFSQSFDISGRLLVLLDPLSNQPFPGNIMPGSRLEDVYAFRVRPQAEQPVPAISENGIVSGTGDTGPSVAAPGGLISIYGSNLASAGRVAAAARSRLPITLEDAVVRIGGRSAGLLYVSPEQINAQVPFEVTPGNQVVTVVRSGRSSADFSLRVGAAAPAIFTGAFLKNSDFSIVSENNPARPGDVLLIYCTGLGAVQPAVASGQLTPSSPLSLTAATPRVTIGGVEAQVVNSLLSPGFVGLYQIGVVTPSGLPGGTASVVVTVGAISSAPKALYTAF